MFSLPAEYATEAKKSRLSNHADGGVIVHNKCSPTYPTSNSVQANLLELQNPAEMGRSLSKISGLPIPATAYSLVACFSRLPAPVYSRLMP